MATALAPNAIGGLGDIAPPQWQQEPSTPTKDNAEEDGVDELLQSLMKMKQEYAVQLGDGSEELAFGPLIASLEKRIRLKKDLDALKASCMEHVGPSAEKHFAQLGYMLEHKRGAIDSRESADPATSELSDDMKDTAVVHDGDLASDDAEESVVIKVDDLSVHEEDQDTKTVEDDQLDAIITKNKLDANVTKGKLGHEVDPAAEDDPESTPKMYNTKSLTLCPQVHDDDTKDATVRRESLSITEMDSSYTSPSLTKVALGPRSRITSSSQSTSSRRTTGSQSRRRNNIRIITNTSLVEALSPVCGPNAKIVDVGARTHASKYDTSQAGTKATCALTESSLFSDPTMNDDACDCSMAPTVISGLQSTAPSLAPSLTDTQKLDMHTRIEIATDEIRELLVTNAEIFYRCIGSMDMGGINTKDCLKQFTRYGFDTIRVRTGASTQLTTEASVTTRAFDLTTLSELPPILDGCIDVQYKSAPFSGFVSYECIFESVRQFHAEVSDLFLPKLKDHLEAVHLCLLEVDEWLRESNSNINFIEGIFRTKLDTPTDADFTGQTCTCLAGIHPTSYICLQCQCPLGFHHEVWDGSSYKKRCPKSNTYFKCRDLVLKTFKMCNELLLNENGYVKREFDIDAEVERRELADFLDFISRADHRMRKRRQSAASEKRSSVGSGGTAASSKSGKSGPAKKSTQGAKKPTKAASSSKMTAKPAKKTTQGAKKPAKAAGSSKSTAAKPAKKTAKGATKKKAKGGFMGFLACLFKKEKGSHQKKKKGSSPSKNKK